MEQILRKEFGPLAAIFSFADKHKTLTNIILIIEIIAIIWVVITYDFTTAL